MLFNVIKSSQFVYFGLVDCYGQSEDEDLDIAPQQTDDGFTFDPNVQMPEDGFQLWTNGLPAAGYLINALTSAWSSLSLLCVPAMLWRLIIWVVHTSSIYAWVLLLLLQPNGSAIPDNHTCWTANSSIFNGPDVFTEVDEKRNWRWGWRT